MSNQYRANDHLFNKLFLAYAKIYSNNTYKNSTNLKNIIDDNSPKIKMMVLEYFNFTTKTDDNKTSSMKDVLSIIPSGSAIVNYSNYLYDNYSLPDKAENKCRIVLRAIYKNIYKEAEERSQLNAVKDTIADIIHESRELRIIDLKELRQWIDNLDNVYSLIDIALLSSTVEIENAVKKLADRIQSKEEAKPSIPAVQFVLGVTDTNTITNMQNAIIGFRNNLSSFYSDEIFLCRSAQTSKIERDYQSGNFCVSVNEKYVLVLDHNVSSVDELVYQLLKHDIGSRRPLLEIWMKDNVTHHGQQNINGIKLLKDANEQGFRVNTYKDIADILLDFFCDLIDTDNNWPERDIHITNAHLYVDGKEIISLEQSSPYNCAQAELLNKRISDLTEQLQDNIKEKMYILEKIEWCRYQLQGYIDNMDDILTMLISNHKSQNANLSKYQDVSFWGNDNESARKDLEDPQWKRFLEKSEKSIDKGLQKLKEYMESRFLLIQILQSQITEGEHVTNTGKICKLYEELESLSLKYNIHHEMIFRYANYLNRVSHNNECILKAERLLKLCEIYDDNHNLQDRVCILLGDANREIGKYDNSFDYLNRVLTKTYDRNSKIWLKATVSKLYGLFLTNNMNSFGPILATIPKSVLNESYDDPDMIMIQARIYHDQGLYHAHNAEFIDAINSYEKAIHLYRSLGEKYEKDSLRAAELADEMTRSINNLSDLYMLQDNYNLELAESGFTKAFEIADRYSAPSMFPRIFEPKKAIYILKLANIMKEKHEYDSAISKYTEAIAIRNALAMHDKKHRRGLMNARLLRADLYLEMNELKAAKDDLNTVKIIINDEGTDNSSATLEVRCNYYSSLAVLKLIERDEHRKEQYDLAIKHWDEFTEFDSIYANRKKNEFIRRYEDILNDQNE